MNPSCGIYLLDVSLIDFDEAFSLLSEKETEEVSRKLQEKDRRLALGKFLLIHSCLKGCALAKQENGKPFIKDSGLHISFSHCYPYVALMIYSEPCGIDIEAGNAYRFDFLDKAFDEGEEDFGLTLQMRWNLKEAAYKALGEGYFKYKERIADLDESTFHYMGQRFHYVLYELDGATMAAVSVSSLDHLPIIEKHL